MPFVASGTATSNSIPVPPICLSCGWRWCGISRTPCRAQRYRRSCSQNFPGLPRRAAVLDRQANNVTVKLWGTAPHFGPMKFPIDSEFADISFIPGTHETGRNRVELVLQTRDPAIDSDLAWSDAGTVSPAVIGAVDDSSGGAVVNPGGIFAQPARLQRIGRTVPLRAGGAVTLANAVELAAGNTVSDRLSDRIGTIPTRDRSADLDGDRDLAEHRRQAGPPGPARVRALLHRSHSAGESRRGRSPPTCHRGAPRLCRGLRDCHIA